MYQISTGKPRCTHPRMGNEIIYASVLRTGRSNAKIRFGLPNISHGTLSKASKPTTAGGPKNAPEQSDFRGISVPNFRLTKRIPVLAPTITIPYVTLSEMRRNKPTQKPWLTRFPSSNCQIRFSNISRQIQPPTSPMTLPATICPNVNVMLFLPCAPDSLFRFQFYCIMMPHYCQNNLIFFLRIGLTQF